MSAIKIVIKVNPNLLSQTSRIMVDGKFAYRSTQHPSDIRSNIVELLRAMDIENWEVVVEPED